MRGAHLIISLVVDSLSFNCLWLRFQAAVSLQRLSLRAGQGACAQYKELHAVLPLRDRVTLIARGLDTCWALPVNALTWKKNPPPCHALCDPFAMAMLQITRARLVQIFLVLTRAGGKGIIRETLRAGRIVAVVFHCARTHNFLA